MRRTNRVSQLAHRASAIEIPGAVDRTLVQDDAHRCPAPEGSKQEAPLSRGRLSLRFKFILWVVSLVMYLCLALGLVFVHLTQQNVREELRRRGIHMAQLLAHKSCPYIIKRDIDALDFLVRSTVQDEDVIYASICGPDGLPLATTNPNVTSSMGRNSSQRSPKGSNPPQTGDIAETLEIAAAVTAQMASAWGLADGWGWQGNPPEQLGTVVLGLSTTREGKAVAIISRQLAPLILLSCLLSIVGTILAERKITKPIEEVVRATRAIASGDLSLRVSIRSSDELGQLALSFNQMADALCSTMKKLECYSHGLEDKVRQRTVELETKTRALQEANVELQELDRLKSGYVSNVSHELRTPLTSIKAIAEILGQQGQNLPREQTLEFLRIIENQTDRLTKLITDILDFSRLERAQAHQLQPVEMAGAVYDAFNSVKGVALDRGIGLTFSAPEDIPRALAQKDKVVQVLVNLLGNALKFTSRDGSVSVRLHYLRDEGIWWNSPRPVSGILVSVEDTGIGIPKDQLEAIFDRFKQVERAAWGQPTGSGLGLSISKEIVEGLGGSIWAESELGQGSTFYFTLRVADSDKLSPPEGSEEEAAPRTPTTVAETV
jgi:signal transduction histidine kinase